VVTAAPPFGMTLAFPDVPFHEHPGLYAELGALGYDDLWTYEVGGVDAFTPLALAAVAAPSARLGTAIVPAFTRGPALIAMQAATLANLAPGRFSLGIGTSSNVIVRSWNGIPFERPVGRTRDLLRFLRPALAGEKVTLELDTFAVSGFRLENPPAEPPPVLVAALRETMLRLAGADADGVILNWLSADDVARVAGVVHDAAGGAPREIVARIFVIPTADADVARAVARREIAAYFNVPVYAAFAEWLGRGPQLAGMWEAWRAGDRKAALAALPDEVVDALVVHGSPEACRAHLRRYVDNGVTRPIARPLPAPGLGAREAARLLVEG
jgi:probable F420-dependent oxidoreductase